MAAWSASVSTRRSSPSVKHEPSSLLITWITPSSAFFLTIGTHSMLRGTSPVRSARSAWWRGSRLASSRRSGWRWRATQPAMPRSQPRRTPSIPPGRRPREALHPSPRRERALAGACGPARRTRPARRRQAEERALLQRLGGREDQLVPLAVVEEERETLGRGERLDAVQHRAQDLGQLERGGEGAQRLVDGGQVVELALEGLVGRRCRHLPAGGYHGAPCGRQHRAPRAPSLPASGRHDPQAERPRGGSGTDAGARDQLVLGGDVALQLRHHLAGEEPQARLGEIVGHAAVAEDAVERLGAGALLDVEHLLVALLGRAVDLEAEEELRHRVDSARRGHPLLHLLVGLVAAHLRQMVADQLVVLDDGAPVGADVAAAELLRQARVLVAERPAADDRRRRIRAVHLAVDPAVVVQLPRHHVPRLLRDDQEADAEPGHDDRRLGRDRGGLGPAAKRLERPRSELAPLLLHEAAVELAIAALEPLEDHLRRLAEDRAAVLLVHAEPFELHAPEPATEAEDQAPVRYVIEHHHLLGHAQGAVPGQHHHPQAALG